MTDNAKLGELTVNQTNKTAEGELITNGRLLADNNPTVDFGGEASRQMGKVGGSIGGQMTKRLVEAGLRQLMEERKG